MTRGRAPDTAGDLLIQGSASFWPLQGEHHRQTYQGIDAGIPQFELKKALAEARANERLSARE